MKQAMIYWKRKQYYSHQKNKIVNSQSNTTPNTEIYSLYKVFVTLNIN